MTTYTFSPAQAKAAVNAWNELANEENQLSVDQAHLLCGDNFDAEMENSGCALIEIRQHQSCTGAPRSFYIMEEDVTAE